MFILQQVHSKQQQLLAMAPKHATYKDRDSTYKGRHSLGLHRIKLDGPQVQPFQAYCQI